MQKKNVLEQTYLQESVCLMILYRNEFVIDAVSLDKQ